MAVMFGTLAGVLIGLGAGGAIARTFFLLGLRVAGDRALDEALDPGEEIGQVPSPPSAPESTGPIRRVGESSGRHAKPEWPDSDDGPEMDTSVMSPVGQEVRA